VPSLTVVFRDFLECLQYRCVGWILMKKIRVRVGMKASKMAEIQQSARLEEEGDGMQGGGRKGEEDERRLGLMRDCMMRDAATIVGRLS
jgi:hypothetical protein